MKILHVLALIFFIVMAMFAYQDIKHPRQPKAEPGPVQLYYDLKFDTASGPAEKPILTIPAPKKTLCEKPLPWAFNVQQTKSGRYVISDGHRTESYLLDLGSGFYGWLWEGNIIVDQDSCRVKKEFWKWWEYDQRQKILNQ